MIRNPNWVAVLNKRANETKTERTNEMNKFRSSASEKGKGCIVIFLLICIFIDDCILCAHICVRPHWSAEWERKRRKDSIRHTFIQAQPHHKFISHLIYTVHLWSFNFKPHASFVFFAYVTRSSFIFLLLCAHAQQQPNCNRGNWTWLVFFTYTLYSPINKTKTNVNISLIAIQHCTLIWLDSQASAWKSMHTHRT